MAKLGDHPIIAERRLEALRHALGATALAALIDPDVVEILANPDGQLILDKIGGGRVATGETLTPEARDRVIRLIADYVGEPVLPEDPRLHEKPRINWVLELSSRHMYLERREFFEFK